MRVSILSHYTLFALAVLIFCTAFTQDQQEDIYPTIVLSEKYNKLGDHAKTYYIKPAAGFLIDARSLKLSDAGKHPSKIFLISEGTIYVMPFSSEKIMIADALHLTNAQGIQKFEGYKAGNTFSIGIGELEVKEENKVSVKMAWACLVKVK